MTNESSISTIILNLVLSLSHCMKKFRMLYFFEVPQGSILRPIKKN